MEFELGAKQVNTHLLEEEMSGFPTWNGFKESGGTYYAVVTDLSEQAQIQTVFDAHDGSALTEDQQAELAIKQMYEEATTSRRSPALVKAYNDLATESMRNQLLSGVTPATFNPHTFCAEVYQKWRILYEQGTNNMKLRFMMYAAIHDPDLIQYPLPEAPTIEYMARFNRMISGTLGYMTDLFQMRR